jgi:phospholipid/cholesterol/gamma-HCH transport system permease protein
MAAAPDRTAGAGRPAALSFSAPDTWILTGSWTVLCIGELARATAPPAPLHGPQRLVIDGSKVDALDTVGALLVDRWLVRPGESRQAHASVDWRGWTPAQGRLMARVDQQGACALPRPPAAASWLVRLGMSTAGVGTEMQALLGLVGECALAFAASARHPARARWRPVLHHITVSGLSALPIVGLLSLLMGVVIAFQGADQLARYGANVFVVDLVGLSMLREFAPLVTAIIVAGRSGAAFAAQLGTMVVTEEVDALRTLGISPVQQLVLPRLLALLVVLPLLTMFADVLGVVGGMLMARGRLNVDYAVFMDRLPLAVDPGTLAVGIGKAPIFAAIIAIVGCVQGLRTRGGADAVGTQTTRAVVQSIFLVIVADALFSVAFSLLDL